MDALLAYLEQERPQLIRTIREMVECESPSDDAAAVDRFVDLFAAQVADIADVQTFDAPPFGKNLQCTFRLPGRADQGQVMALGHSDTVWPMGTLRSMPFREEQGRLWGPGVLDMKAGLAFFVYAMRALRELDVPVPYRVVLQVNSDEEVGSENSRALTERTAKESRFVLVLEPGTGLTGKLKTARKGVGDYTVAVSGQAAHAGVDFTSGASAIVELAQQITRIAGFTRLEEGITVNPGVIRGGTRTNVIAAEAAVEVDIRIARMADAAWLEKQFHSLQPIDPRCRLTVTGGLNRPPMERTEAIAGLFALARELGRTVGMELEESSTGGGSDGNFTAALGVPTLDGVGAVGEGAHAPHESILVDHMTNRAALLAKLVASGRLSA